MDGVLVNEDGSLGGQFLGIEALYLLLPLFQPLFTVSNLLRACRHITEMARQGGITFLAELMLGVFALPLEQKIFKVFFNDENTPMRCAVIVKADKAIEWLGGLFRSTSKAVASVLALSKTSTSKLIYNGGVKFFTGKCLTKNEE
jgi:hypothetical protein